MFNWLLVQLTSCSIVQFQLAAVQATDHRNLSDILETRGLTWLSNLVTSLQPKITSNWDLASPLLKTNKKRHLWYLSVPNFPPSCYSSFICEGLNETTLGANTYSLWSASQTYRRRHISLWLAFTCVSAVPKKKLNRRREGEEREREGEQWERGRLDSHSALPRWPTFQQRRCRRGESKPRLQSHCTALQREHVRSSEL